MASRWQMHERCKSMQRPCTGWRRRGAATAWRPGLGAHRRLHTSDSCPCRRSWVDGGPLGCLERSGAAQPGRLACEKGRRALGKLLEAQSAREHCTTRQQRRSTPLPPTSQRAAAAAAGRRAAHIKRSAVECISPQPSYLDSRSSLQCRGRRTSGAPPTSGLQCRETWQHSRPTRLQGRRPNMYEKPNM